MSAQKKPDGQNKSGRLREEDVVSEETRIGRRSALSILGIAALGAGSATSLVGCFFDSPQYGGVGTGLTDNDSGQWADPSGNGRGGARGVYTGLTDGDSGAYADPSGQGRGRGGRGGATGLTDSDQGPYADPSGNGRGTARLGYTGMTDGDQGPYAVPVNQGRGRW